MRFHGKTLGGPGLKAVSGLTHPQKERPLSVPLRTGSAPDDSMRCPSQAVIPGTRTAAPFKRKTWSVGSPRVA